jgi:malate synthase
MEDAATAEISRAQIWQWRVNGVSTQDDGQLITADRITDIVDHEVNRQSQNGAGRWLLAGRLVSRRLSRSI